MMDLADRRDGVSQGPSDDLSVILGDNKKLLGHMQKIISNAIEREASDIHLVPGYPVTYRVHGNLTPVGTSPVPRGAINPIAQAMTPPRLRARLDAGQDCDYSIAAKVGAHHRRFRVNAFKGSGGLVSLYAGCSGQGTYFRVDGIARGARASVDRFQQWSGDRLRYHRLGEIYDTRFVDQLVERAGWAEESSPLRSPLSLFTSVWRAL